MTATISNVTGSTNTISSSTMKNLSPTLREAGLSGAALCGGLAARALVTLLLAELLGTLLLAELLGTLLLAELLGTLLLAKRLAFLAHGPTGLPRLGPL